MNHELPPAHAPINLTRRDVLVRALGGGLAAAALPAPVYARQAVSAVTEAEFVPEDDYPFFGEEKVAF